VKGSESLLYQRSFPGLAVPNEGEAKRLNTRGMLDVETHGKSRSDESCSTADRTYGASAHATESVRSRTLAYSPSAR
jgi:hypothetical protein